MSFLSRFRRPYNFQSQITKEKNKLQFVFDSNFILDDLDMEKTVEIIIRNHIEGRISGYVTARDIFRVFSQSNPQISSVNIGAKKHGKIWFIKIR